MSNQRIMETVLALRKKCKRKLYDSDSDHEIDRNTNRGCKLKKRARFVRQGQLAAQFNALPPSHEVVEHGGYRRAILHRNPPLVDDDGYDIDSSSDEERVEAAMARKEGENPYSEVRIERLLAPLTSVTDLPAHPTLSRPFTSKGLTELTSKACELTHKENAALWKAKPLLAMLMGENLWAPCGIFTAPGDEDLFATGRSIEYAAHVAQGANMHDLPQAPDVTDGNNGSARAADDLVKGAIKAKRVDRDHGSAATDAAKATGDLDSTVARPSSPNSRDADATDAPRSEPGPSHHPTVTDSLESDQLFIHPLFIPPPSARPTPTLGLLDSDLDDISRLVQMYVQKQEEVCRGAQSLHEGLLKAERRRRTVLAWAKAEAHCGANRDMSDSEDWYDREEWGLTEELKKGQDEEEDIVDTTVQQQKKTRNRR